MYSGAIEAAMHWGDDALENILLKAGAEKPIFPPKKVEETCQIKMPT